MEPVMRMQRDVTLLKTSVTLLQRDVKLRVRHTDCRAQAAKHGACTTILM